MPLQITPDGTITEVPTSASGDKVLVLFNGVQQEATLVVPTEVSFPSYIPSTAVYEPASDLQAAGVSLVNGRVVLDTIIKEVAGNV